MTALNFSDAQIRRLFGSEDAETENSDRFHEYFVKNRAYENLRADLPLRILVGHKGVGKSALLRYSFDEDVQSGILSIFLKPDDLADLLKVPAGSDINTLIEAWKVGIKKAVAEKAVENFTEGSVDKIDESTIKVGARKLTAIVKDALTKYKPDISAAAHSVIFDNFLSNSRVNIYIDDIDRGWSARPQDIINISALINALKDISGNDSDVTPNLHPVAIRASASFLPTWAGEARGCAA